MSNCPLSFVVSEPADSGSVGADPSRAEPADTESGDAAGVAVVSPVNTWVAASVAVARGPSSAIATPTAESVSGSRPGSGSKADLRTETPLPEIA